MVLLIVTTADGCCCASNGRAVFALFCPKKHGRRKFGKSKTRGSFGSRWAPVEMLQKAS